MAVISYNYERHSEDSLEIEHLGNVCIEGYNENEGFLYYLLVKTTLGTARIFSFGPVPQDSQELLDNYSVDYHKVEYSDAGLKKMIYGWLNDKNRGITKSRIIEEEDFISAYVDIINLLMDENTPDGDFVA